MRPHDMKYIGFKYQRENKQNSDKLKYCGFQQEILVKFEKKKKKSC